VVNERTPTFAVGLLNTLPPTVAVIGMYLWSRHSDHTNERAWHVIVACLAAAVGLVLAGLSTTVVAVVAALMLIGITSAKPPLWSMPTMFLSGPAAAAGLAAINSIGNLGGFAGPAMIGWIKSETGGFAGGLYLVCGLPIVSATVTFLVSRSVVRPSPIVKPA
jgi:MFS transporter, ACS family, tartrate transporter